MDDTIYCMAMGFVIACLMCGSFFSDDVNAREIEKGYELCESNGGLKKIEGYMLSDTFVCNNGAEFSLDLEQIKKKK